MRMNLRSRRALAAVAVVGVTGAMTAGCLGGGSSGGSSSSDKTITVWTSVDQPVMDGMSSVVVPEAKKQGITVKFQKVDNINQLIMTKLQGGGAPDIALIPQPGVVADIVKRNKAFPLDGVVDQSQLDDLLPGATDAGTVNGKLYGLLVSANAKSLVFYPKKAWASAGYKPPTSLSGLEQLTNQIKSDGNTPWCFGIGSDAATGWPATDWMEDLVMRYGSVQDYHDWVSHKLTFESPLVKQAGAEMQKLLLTPGNVQGGGKGAAATGFDVTANPMFDAKPGCWMLKQGNFITGFFPKKIIADIDNQVGVFYFPPVKAGGASPLLGGGDLATMLNDSDSTKAVMKLLSEPNVGIGGAKNDPGYLSPHKSFASKYYPSKLAQSIAKIATGSDVLLFDGSDSMPGAVGAGTFWKDMTAWISGNESLDTALKNIDDSWPAS